MIEPYAMASLVYGAGAIVGIAVWTVYELATQWRLERRRARRYRRRPRRRI